MLKYKILYHEGIILEEVARNSCPLSGSSNRDVFSEKFWAGISLQIEKEFLAETASFLSGELDVLGGGMPIL